MKYSLLFISCFHFSIFAQDTLKVMHYNVLNYGGAGGTCLDINAKNTYLKRITDWKKPDIFTVNELVMDMQGGQNTVAKSILDNVLNTNGISKYKRAGDTGIGSQVNMLYYNSDLLHLYDQDFITEDLNGNSIVRHIDVYRLYYLNANDTIYLDHFVAHLKAANTTADILERALAAEAVMAYIDNHNTSSNRLISGDFNIKGASEDAFQHFINYSSSSIRFNDPINELGEWNNNSAFKNIHTQSTHTTGSCFSSGGMDDRFDFILTSDDIIDGDAGLEYINDSYAAIGQDGNMFNQPVPIAGNAVVNANIAEALYNISDHLPVYMELWADPSTIGIKKSISNTQIFRCNNPIQDFIQLQCKAPIQESYMATLYNLEGLEINQWNILSTSRMLDVQNIPSGMYILKISSSSEPWIQSIKLIKH